MAIIRKLGFSNEILKGVQPKTINCKGPEISQNKGDDAVCCARCFFLRTQKYVKAFSSTSNPIAFEYLDEIDFADKSSLIIPLCSEKRVIYYPQLTFISSMKPIINGLQEQFKIRHRLGIVDKQIEASQIVCNNFNVPLIIPQDKTQKRQAFKTENTGVSYDRAKKTITILSLENAFNSGEYMYIINYYQAKAILEAKPMETNLKIF